MLSMFISCAIKYLDRFCGTWFVDAEEKCSLERHCRDDSDCVCDKDTFGADCEYCVPDTPNCNILDLLEKEHGENWKKELEKQIAIMNGEEWDDDEVVKSSESEVVVIHRLDLDEDDPRRNNFCGSTWADANSKCQRSCLGGEAEECPPGLSCFAQVSLHYKLK